MTKKRRPPKLPPTPTDPLSPEALKATQAKHFRALESWALEQPATVCGVPIVWCLNYDLIQVTNQAYLTLLLQQAPATVEANGESEKVEEVGVTVEGK